MKYKYLFIDFDGTLFDSYDHCTGAFVKALKDLRNEEVNYNEAYYQLKISLYDAKQYYHLNEKEYAYFKKYYDDDNFKPLIVPYDGLKNVLEKLTLLGVELFIYTNRDEKTIQYLKKYDVDKYFKDFILGNTFKYKPDPTSLLYMIDKYKLDKNKCLVVGDRKLDVDGAINANIDSVLINCLDKNVNSTYKINSLYDLIELIK